MCFGIMLQKLVDGVRNALLFAVDWAIIKYAGQLLDLQKIIEKGG